jgi:2-keto-4-pentenoate hydratase/2-oxohepta-3-ene-1,7-dioic acid hydratase in catechol pathway
MIAGSTKRFDGERKVIWACVEQGGRVAMGVVQDDSLALYDREPFHGGKATGEVIALDGARWLPPCRPTKMIALWNNFHAAAAKNSWATPPEPLYFLKSPNSYSAHLAPIPKPKAYDGRIVYEGELGIVIGAPCDGISAADAPGAIFGFTCINDVTALDLLFSDASFPQWTRAKGFDGFGIFGPVIATDIDPAGLHVQTFVNGRERQNYPVSDMIFSPAEIVSRISRDMTLYPGDVIACGTSLGVLPMRDGTVVDVVIEGIGKLTNRFGGNTVG